MQASQQKHPRQRAVQESVRRCRCQFSAKSGEHRPRLFSKSGDPSKRPRRVSLCVFESDRFCKEGRVRCKGHATLIQQRPVQADQPERPHGAPRKEKEVLEAAEPQSLVAGGLGPSARPHSSCLRSPNYSFRRSLGGRSHGGCPTGGYFCTLDVPGRTQMTF
ncbi:Hypothetical predicted protein [Podarcis lilfordi]|uniref:Uncharacterized protein n=1 Tax=Podarcis lilfordi TaxID=74358 RepID=A0AA35PUZ0_9SAUR|nr:Hypothetical predicted protein [Podarcis lilfordi]